MQVALPKTDWDPLGLGSLGSFMAVLLVFYYSPNEITPMDNETSAAA